MSLAIDEFGRAYIVIKEQDKKKRLKGQEAFKSNILAATTVANILRTSLGPKGMDKMIVSPDNEVMVTNDGATILEKMEVEHQTARLLVELSKSQDNEIGDGTTGVVILAGALLEQAQPLIEKGLHPLKVASGYEKACEIAVNHIKTQGIELDITKNNHEYLKQCAITALGSKIVSKYQRNLAEIAVEAILSVADLERKDVNFDLIKIEGKTGGSIEDTRFINGIVIDKDFSHPQMVKTVVDPKICILTCPFEPPKPKTKHTLEVKSAADYKKLYEIEQNYFRDMVKKVKDSGATLVLCQWGFDDEANHLLMQNELPSVRWVGGVEIELIAIATGSRIIPRFAEITEEKLGKAAFAKEIEFGTTNDHIIIIEGCSKSKAVTILVRGGSKTVVDECHRCLHDALCVVRNLILDNTVVCGGGSAEISCSNAINKEADKIATVEQYAVRGFAEALDQIPYSLAENSGYSAIEYISNLKALQIRDNYEYYGVDCLKRGTNDMKIQEVYETLKSKVQQLELATQVVKMILKIDDVITPDEYA